ncbi:MAG: fumarylacetoacetate hydrolase family protein [Elioraea sp.]|nr:fumarylacetoacetate hydrolase family protein [Elioraea sp.]
MAYLFDPPPQPALPVFGTDLLFPVRRIWCVGRNYAEHAREMGHDPDREPPFFFAKPADAVVASGSIIPFPMATEDLHHEIELVVAIGQGGVAIDAERAFEHVFGYAVGLDMTRRDRQAEAKRLARPWEMGKAFDRSAPMSAIAPASRIGHPSRGAIVLAVNGEIRQAGDLAQQIWSVAETIAHLSRLVELAPGDLIMTGTPAGVGPVRPGDRLEGRIEAVGELSVTYAAA